ncbi:hypothetical protein K2173_002735 [Erythroxylum novogranatense]|uniref:Uncharacterized protein n=1 Tax=Erythroxylum novogranatense TaxID=1862640 RepID=A0AAV8SQN8_9ROSI|nr:hypothetical protein K2173_002735 [Erythroxylum novogranatense]
MLKVSIFPISKFESLSIFPSLNRSLPLFQPSMNLREGIRPAVMYQSYFFMKTNGVLNSEALKNPKEAKTDGACFVVEFIVADYHWSRNNLLL